MAQPIRPIFAFLLVYSGGCSKEATSLPESMSGSYQRANAPAPDAFFGERPEELTVSSTGIAIGGGSRFDHGPDSVQIGFEPGGIKGTVGAGAPVDTFLSVKCASGKSSCTFKTKGGCEGSVDRDDAGALTVFASGACGRWSGKWVRSRDHR